MCTCPSSFCRHTGTHTYWPICLFVHWIEFRIYAMCVSSWPGLDIIISDEKSLFRRYRQRSQCALMKSGAVLYLSPLYNPNPHPFYRCPLLIWFAREKNKLNYTSSGSSERNNGQTERILRDFAWRLDFPFSTNFCAPFRRVSFIFLKHLPSALAASPHSVPIRRLFRCVHCACICVFDEN